MDLNELNRQITALLAKRPDLGTIGMGKAKDLGQQQLDMLRESSEKLKRMIEDIHREHAADEARRASAVSEERAAPPAMPNQSVPKPAATPRSFPVGEFVMVRHQTAKEVLEEYEAPESVRGRAVSGQTPRALFDLLIQEGQREEALQFLVYALPKRASVLWGALGLRHVMTPAELPELQVEAWRAVCTWILRCDEPSRHVARLAAQRATAMQPAGGLAWAVLGHSGSLNAPDLPTIPPPKGMTHRAVHGSLRMTLAQSDPTRSAETMDEVLYVGVLIAMTRVRHVPGAKVVQFAPLSREHTPIRDLFVSLLGELGITAPEFQSHADLDPGDIWKEWQ